MSALARTVAVIRLVRIAGPRGAAATRAVVADVGRGEMHIDVEGHEAYLIVPHDRPLAQPGTQRRSVSDICVGDVVGWVADAYGALWVADQVAPGAEQAGR